MTATVADVVAVLDGWYPPQTAESWDRVGLAVGDPAAAVTKILYTVDCTAAVVAEAAAVGADLVVAHHPLLLRGVHAVTEDHPKGRIVAELIRRGSALLVAHTNADKPPRGVVAALAEALGLVATRPLVPSPAQPLDVVVTYVPVDLAPALVDALANAGAGAIGDYDRCSFRGLGEGTFRPLPGAQPHIGTTGTVQQVAEARVEMVLPRARRHLVVQALLAAHPYETPAYHLIEAGTLEYAASPGGAGLGRIGTVGSPVSLAEFAAVVGRALPRSGGGIRVCGDPDRLVEVVAVQAGAGDDLLDVARASSADVYVTSDLRHHPASEAAEWPGAPALIDIPHWAAESLWLPVVQRLVDEELTGDRAVPSVLSAVVTDPWSFAVPAGDGAPD